MKLKFILYSVLLSILFVSCDKDDPGIEPDPFKRTVLMYMVASNLGNSMNNNINQMIKAATAQNLNNGNLIVYLSDSNQNAELFQIKEGKNGVVTKHHIRDYQGQSAIGPEVMHNVVHEVFSEFPADSYALMLSSHAASWFPENVTNILRWFGEEKGKKMEIYDLASALEGFKLDFLLLDACSLGGIDCLYELRNTADYIISSPSEVMGAGFPYHLILPDFYTKEVDYDSIAKSFYDYYKSYSNPYGNVSVIKTSELAQLATITKEIIASAGKEEGIQSLPLSELQVLTYQSAIPVKLYDFADVIKRLATEEQYAQFEAELKKVVISKYSTDIIYCGRGEGDRGSYFYSVKTFSGLSVYPMPVKHTQLNEWYRNNTAWYKAVYE